MAVTGSTYWYASGPNTQLENVLEGFGSISNSSLLVELYIANSLTAVTDSGASVTTTSRMITKAEVLICLEMIKEQIVRDTSGKFT